METNDGSLDYGRIYVRRNVEERFDSNAPVESLDAFVRRCPQGTLSVSGIDENGAFSIRGEYHVAEIGVGSLKEVVIDGVINRLRRGRLEQKAYSEKIGYTAFALTVELASQIYDSGRCVLAAYASYREVVDLGGA